MSNQTEIEATKPRTSAKSRTQELGTLMVTADRIHLREGFNVRKTFDAKDLIKLADSIRRNGQIDACSVVDASKEHGDGHYYLIQGERRLRAMRDVKLGDGYTKEGEPKGEVIEGAHPTVPVRCTIFAEEKAQGINIGGNRDRADVKHWERAEAIAAALARGEDRKEIMAQWGISSPTVSNENSLRTKLSPESWEAFKNDGSLANFMLTIYKLSPEAQAKALAKHLEDRAAVAAQRTKDGKGRKRAKKRKPSQGSGPDAEERAAFVAGVLAARRAGTVKGQRENGYLDGMVYAARYLTGEKIPRGEDVPTYIAKAIKAAAKAEAEGANDGADD